MAKRAAPFTESDVKRALKAVLAMGLTVREVLATNDGVRVVVATELDGKQPPNPWDQP